MRVGRILRILFIFDTQVLLNWKEFNWIGTKRVTRPLLNFNGCISERRQEVASYYSHILGLEDVHIMILICIMMRLVQHLILWRAV
jgi:hypothetical protein